jgi:hypothetical protein
MKKKLTVLGILLLSISLLLAAEENQIKKSLSFIIKGGWGTARIGDINAYYKSRCADEIFNIPENEGNKVPQLSSGFASVEVEGQYALSDHFSLGLAIGSPIIKSDKAIWYINLGGSTQPVVMEPKVTVYIPIKFNLYYHIPLSSRFQLLIGGGVGIYPAKLSFIPSEIIYGDVNTFSHFPLGIQGVCRIDTSLTKKISLILEGEWRLAKLTDFKGEEILGNFINKGTLWYCKELYLGSNTWWDELDISKSAPQYDPLGQVLYKDQRKAIFDLSGFSLRTGISLSF